MKPLFIALATLLLTIAYPAAGQSTTDPSDNPGSSSSVSSASANTTNETPGLHERNPRYQLRKGDTFDLDFDLSPEFNQTVAVEPDGYVTLKGVGSIFVEGQTVPQLTETVKTSYARILHDPVIAITLRDFEKPYFIAGGQVGKPGKYDLRSDLTVTEAVAIAGGFNDKSKHSQVVLFRPAPGGGYEAKLINAKKLLASRDLSEDIHLQPGDMIYIPQNALSKIRPFLPTSSMSAYVGSGIL
jgi:polysaccharide export outer membrane protein